VAVREVVNLPVPDFQVEHFATSASLVSMGGQIGFSVKIASIATIGSIDTV
jgi:hypothetical protein